MESFSLFTPRNTRVDEPIDTWQDAEYWRYNHPTLPDAKQSEDSFLTYTRRSRMDGWNIKDYRLRKKRGDLLPHLPFVRRVFEGNSTGSWNLVVTDDNIQWKWNSIWAPYPYWTIDDDDIDSYAPELDYGLVTAAAAAIYGKGHDSLTFISELRKTRKMFADTARRFIRARPPTKREVGDYFKLSSGAVSEWLQTRYGWRTLLYDIQDLHEAVTSLDDKRTRYSERVGRGYSFSELDTYEEHNYGHFDIAFDIATHVKVSLRGNVTADISPPRFQFDPLQTGWELIPYSFVVDWFVGVGQSLNALAFLALSDAHTCSAGYRLDIERTMTSRITDANKSGEVKSINIQQYGKSTAFKLYRKPSGLPIKPQLTVRLDSLKIADLLALVRQRWP